MMKRLFPKLSCLALTVLLIAPLTSVAHDDHSHGNHDEAAKQLLWQLATKRTSTNETVVTIHSYWHEHKDCLQAKEKHPGANCSQVILQY